jgi:hypothetical protein
MEDKDLFRTKTTVIEQQLIKLEVCTDPADFDAASLNQNLADLKALLVTMQDAAQSRLAKSIVGQHQETYTSLKQQASSALKRVDEAVLKKQLLGSEPSTVDESFSDLLIKEERSLENSLAFTSGILNAASEVKSSLSSQKRSLEGVGDKIVRFAETLPGVNVLLRKVSRRKRLNAVVMSVAVSLSVCVIVYLTFS